MIRTRSLDCIAIIDAKLRITLITASSSSGQERHVRVRRTDLEQVLIGGYRTVILTGVHNAVTEPDLAERCVTMNLSHIAPGQRRLEMRLWKEFDRERPAIFGALLDIVAHGLKQLPQVKVPDLPRLADFALWGSAIENAFATTGSFLAAFTTSQAVAPDATVEVSPVAAAIGGFMEDQNSWDGTTTQLWRALQTRDQAEARPTETKGWPHDPISFGIALTKVIPTLRKIGIAVTRDRATSRRRTPMVHLRKIEPAEAQQGADATSEMPEASERSELPETDRKIVPFRGN